jgi:hypothetical protein
MSYLSCDYKDKVMEIAPNSIVHGILLLWDNRTTKPPDQKETNLSLYTDCIDSHSIESEY